MDMKFKMENDMTDMIERAAFSQIERALIKIGHEAEKNAKHYCPVDTGRLKNSITNTHDKNTVYVGTNVEYAPYVEMGTVNTPAQPYLEPAIMNHLEKYKNIIEETLKS